MLRLPLRLSSRSLRKLLKGLRLLVVSLFNLHSSYFDFILLKAVDVLTQLTPALHGLYRAIISTSYPWSLSQWEQLTTHLNMLVAPDILGRLHLLIDMNQEEDANANVIQFIQTFLARYNSRSRPLSGYFLVCCVIETQWTALAQALAPAQSIACGNIVEAAAANKAWLFLMRKAALNLEVTDEKILDTLKMTLQYAMQCFADLLIHIDEMDSEPSIDTYAWETMSESLVRSFICD
jgi:phosphatidylinositol 4-kinase